MIEQLHQLLSLIDRPSRVKLAGLFLLMLGATVLEMAGLGLLLPFLQLVVEPEGVSRLPLGHRLLAAAGGDPHRLLLALSLGLIAFFIAKNLYLLAVAWLQNRFVMYRMAAVSQAMLERVMAQPYTTYAQRNTAEMTRNIRHLVSVAFSKGLMPLLQLALEGTTALGVLAMLLAVEPLATSVVVVVMGGVLGSYFLIMRRRVQTWGERSVHYEAVIQMWLQQSLGAFKELRLSGRAGMFSRAYGDACRSRAAFDVQSTTAPNVPRLLMEAVAASGLALVVVACLLQGRSPASAIPTLGVFALAAIRVAPSLSRLISNITLLRESRKAVFIVHRDFHSLPAPGAENAAAPLAMADGIRLEGLCFTYPNATAPALDDVDLSIGRGESVALVGRSGAGKTTLVDALLGLLPPTGGRITVDGADIAGKIAAWQRSVGYIPQSIYLIDDTLRRNVALGVPDHAIDEERILRACRLAQLDAVIAGLPAGLDTVVGERGARLSGGQRQRIGIARALYDDPQVLVLDEATSALDAETEHEITRAIDALAGLKTVVVIAHRLSTVQHCDRIVLMDSGRVMDSGRFAELEGRNAEFRRMVERSSLKSEES